MEKLRRVLSGQDDEEQGLTSQVRAAAGSQRPPPPSPRAAAATAEGAERVPGPARGAWASGAACARTADAGGLRRPGKRGGSPVSTELTETPAPRPGRPPLPGDPSARTLPARPLRGSRRRVRARCPRAAGSRTLQVSCLRLSPEVNEGPGGGCGSWKRGDEVQIQVTEK